MNANIPRIQHNIVAMNAYRNYSANSKNLTSSIEKLSSGYRINRAGDDAAGLAISEKMRAQISGLTAAKKNANDGINLVQTAEGAMTEVHDMLNRMATLAEQSANGTYDDSVDRVQLQKEVDSLKSEINRIADSTNYNGIKLLDGSLDSERATETLKDSALSAIASEDYTAKGASPAFSTRYITNRPESVTSQTGATFEIDLNDAQINIKSGESFTLTVGSNAGALTLTATTTADVTTATDAATLLAKSGWTSAVTSGLAGSYADAATGAGKTTADIKNGAWAAAAAGGNANNKYAEIDGHIYEMKASGTKLQFTQVDYMGETGEKVHPDFGVSLTTTGANSSVSDMGPDWKVVEPTDGAGIGTSHQARAEVSIDFSQLKDGDKLTAGEKNYVFKVGQNSTVTAGAGETLVDLSTILRDSSDLSDKDRLASAMTKIANTMNTQTQTDAWIVGNGGVKDGVGTLAFQSQSGFADDYTAGANATHRIGGTAGGANIDMRDEGHILAQFVSSRAEAPANTSFDLDVTKIKAGQTFKVNGQTFEFTDGSAASDDNAIAIDLSAEGITGGILSSELNNVGNKIKTAIESADSLKFSNNGPSMFTVTRDGSKIKLTSNDDPATTADFENRTAAKVELPTETTYGKALTLQIGDTSDDFNQLSVNVKDLHVASLGLEKLDISTQEGAAAAVSMIKDAVNYVSDVRGGLGALQNRLDHTINNLGVMTENIQAAESAIRDTDFAEEMMNYTKMNILNQASQAMLAQANQLPQGVLQLIG